MTLRQGEALGQSGRGGRGPETARRPGETPWSEACEGGVGAHVPTTVTASQPAGGMWALPQPGGRHRWWLREGPWGCSCVISGELLRYCTPSPVEGLAS